MKYVITTQYLENYGSHCEDGTYKNENHYWKFKSGTDYIVTGLDRLPDAVAFVQASLHNHGNCIHIKEFPRVWRTFEEWEQELSELESDYEACLRETAKRLDPRGQAVIDLMDREVSTDTTHP